MGCVLNLTQNDYEQLAKIVETCRVADGRLDKTLRDKIRSTIQNTSRPKLLGILEKPDSRAYGALAGLLAGAMVSKLSIAERERLPEAFHTVLKYNPDAMGLFVKAPSHRGPGSSAVQHHYEIMATAALIENPGAYKTTSGKNLFIEPIDRVDFGLKYSRGYAEPRRFGTIEADMLISRGTMNPLSADFGKTVAIDAKFSRTGKYSPKPELQRQLDGIRTGLRDGKVNEFHFVTNGIFTDGFKKAVDKENLLVAKDFVDNNRRAYKDVPQEYLSKEERKSQPEEKTPSGFFTENNEEFKQFVMKFDIPQIELCEHVKYPGT